MQQKELNREKMHIFSDFDGTITQKDTLVFMATELGGGPEMVQALGRLLKTNQIGLRDCIAAEMRSIRVPFAKAEQALREQVALDPHFRPFAHWCRTQKLPLTILSAGFYQTIDLFLDRTEFPEIEVLANVLRPDVERGWQCEFRDDSTWGHDKVMALRAARERGQYTIFIGDGLSDRAAAEAADEVFAKHSLAPFCQEKNIAFHPYETFADVLAALEPRLSDSLNYV
jgi:2,3-diketo-5-methylthio-1-phosphopentane phosphatase